MNRLTALFLAGSAAALSFSANAVNVSLNTGIVNLGVNTSPLNLNVGGSLLEVHHNGAPQRDARGFYHMPKAPRGYASAPYSVQFFGTSGGGALSPSQVRHFYGFDQISNQGAGQTIAIVDAYDDPNIASDLNTFSQNYGLPTCTGRNPCFKKIYATGVQPQADSGWSLEIALDVEWAHAIAPQAKIILVEAASSSFTDLMKAVDVAVSNGAKVVSMSFGGGDFSGETTLDSHFSKTGVTFIASAGDSGSAVNYPAASPNVVAIGGTTVISDSYGNYQGESAWSGSGGGISAYEPEPSWQVNAGINTNGKRGVPDVAYDADPNTGFSIYNSYSYNGQAGWFNVGGTSAGSPQWAGLFAVTNSMRVAQAKATLSTTASNLYSAASGAYTWNFHDITSGTNGSCGAVCSAASGYDYVTGLGTPIANNLIKTLVAQP